MLIQLAKARGARVLTTVGNEDKASNARECGADETILYRQTDFREQVMRHTDGRGVDVVYDSVGRDTIHRSIRSLKKRGMCILFGASSGVVPSIEPIELAEAGSVFFTRPHLADYMRDAGEIRGRSNDLFGLVDKRGACMFPSIANLRWRMRARPMSIWKPADRAASCFCVPKDQSGCANTRSERTRIYARR